MSTGTGDVQPRLRPSHVAELADRWMLYGGVAEELVDRNVPFNVAVSELVIHELAHAAVFNIRPTRSVAGDVAMRFRRYPASARGKLASDTSECAALSVEKTVLDVLGWRVRWREVERIASEDMYILHEPSAVRREVRKQDRRRINADRAGKVIAWLWRLTGTGPGTSLVRSASAAAGKDDK